MPMTKEEFKQRWESNDSGGGITFDDVADCAVAWGLCSTPKTLSIDVVCDLVVCAAGIQETGETK